MLNKRGMFLVDAMMALMIVGLITILLVIALSTSIKSNHIEEEKPYVEELFEEASRLHND